MYENWPGGISKQEVWRSINDEPAQKVADLSAQTTEYEYRGLNDGQNYCFVIRAIEAGTGNTADSPAWCFDSDIVQPVRELDWNGNSAFDPGEITVNWLWNNDAEIQTVVLQRTTDPIRSWNDMINLPLSFPLNRLNSYTDTTGIDNLKKPVFYRIQTVDDCDSIVYSPYLSTLSLHAEAMDIETNLLKWEGPFSETGQVLNYSLYRIKGNQAEKIATLDSLQTSYTDPAGLSGGEQWCYYLIAKVALPQNGMPDRVIEVRSNLYCVEPIPTIITPNAFAPDGLNQVFRPVILNGEPVDFMMTIYDRWGRQLFVTTDPMQGWNGRMGSSDLGQGVYGYYIKMVQIDGRVTEKTGSVLLLR